MPEQPDNTLDPSDWQALRAQGHRMLDDMVGWRYWTRRRCWFA